jgi:hypothetical protein
MCRLLALLRLGSPHTSEMENLMYVMLAPIELKPGVDEKSFLSASDRFEADFVRNQPGIVRRHLLRAKYGGYADLVFFESKEAANRVLEAEATSPECAIFFGLMVMPDDPDMGVLSYEEVKVYS